MLIPIGTFLIIIGVLFLGIGLDAKLSKKLTIGKGQRVVSCKLGEGFKYEDGSEIKGRILMIIEEEKED
jgi:hypothetical protein